MSELLTEKEAARLLKLHPRSLSRMRVQGRGPAFVRHGARLIRYRLQDIEEWGRENLYRSTSEYQD
jgi:hypothetical protein